MDLSVKILPSSLTEEVCMNTNNNDKKEIQTIVQEYDLQLSEADMSVSNETWYDTDSTKSTLSLSGRLY